jgi:hypothetical protein
MKKILFFYFLFFISHSLFSQNVGIGTTAPKARLHVIDSSVLFSASGFFPPVLPSFPPDSNAGRRMMWYPDKAAFRVGAVRGTQWNKDSIGTFSIAMGIDTKAIGSGSLATGQETIASGVVSTAIGFLSKAAGEVAIAIGSGANAAANYCLAIGDNVIANSFLSISMGRFNNPVINEVTSGYVATEPLFIIGNGTHFTDRKNALTILKNGMIGIGNNNTPSNPLSFPVTLEKKVSFYPGAHGDVGMGVGPLLFKIYSDSSLADIAFGYDSYASGFIERMRIKGNGNVGIGVDPSSARLEIRSTSSSPQLLVHQAHTNDYSRIRFKNDNSLSNTRYWDIAGLTDGSLINGVNDRLNFFCSGQGDILSLFGNGNAVLMGNLTQNSDTRLKKDIRPLQNPLQKLIQLNGYNYYWIHPNSDQNLQTGVLAQEVQKFFPDLVKENEKGILSVNYSGLIPVMIESIKEQQQQIDELKKLVKQLLNK